MGQLDGRVCLVTGASSGIGRETARALARDGATVLVVGRNPARTEGVAEELRDEAGHDRVLPYLADFSSLAAVGELADQVIRDHDALHVLVNNAGLWHSKRTVSADGYEDTLAVNHLAPFYLVQRLRPLLEASAPARVVNVSSRLHTREKTFRFDDWQWEKRRFVGILAYRQSKLANVMFSNELARRLAGTGVTSNSLHPGDVATNVTRESRFLQWGLDHIAKYFVMTPEEGARTSLFLATAPEMESVTGRYFRDEKEAIPSPAALDAEACQRLWEMSEALVAKAIPRAAE